MRQNTMYPRPTNLLESLRRLKGKKDFVVVCFDYSYVLCGNWLSSEGIPSGYIAVKCS